MNAQVYTFFSTLVDSLTYSDKENHRDGDWYGLLTHTDEGVTLEIGSVTDFRTQTFEGETTADIVTILVEEGDRHMADFILHRQCA